jgi:hypothetical protein
VAAALLFAEGEPEERHEEEEAEQHAEERSAEGARADKAEAEDVAGHVCGGRRNLVCA